MICAVIAFIFKYFNNNQGAIIFGALAVISFALTLYYMLEEGKETGGETSYQEK